MNYWEEKGFHRLLELNPKLSAIKTYMPSYAPESLQASMTGLENLYSTYKQSAYHYLFYGLVRTFRPVQCVELGVLHGFSLFAVAKALRDNAKGRVNAFDLFEAYPYRHENFGDICARVKKFGMEDIVSIEKADVFDVHVRFEQVDFLHVDVSNNGDTYASIFKNWAKLVSGAMVLEGGGVERDNVEWMHKYNKRSIREALKEIAPQYPDWDIVTLEAYPSLTVAVRRN